MTTVHKTQIQEFIRKTLSDRVYIISTEKAVFGGNKYLVAVRSFDTSKIHTIVIEVLESEIKVLRGGELIR